MDAGLVTTLLNSIGAEKVRVVGYNKISCCCLLAPWFHAKGRDSRPSMVILEGEDGDPIYKCLGCHQTGSLHHLLLWLWTKGRHDVAPWADRLEGSCTTTEAQSRSQKLLGASKQASGFNTEVVPVSKPTEKRREIQQLKRSDGRAWYDYKAIADAEEVLEREEIPYSRYEPYVTGPPEYALERGITKDTCEAFEIGHDPEMKRVLFPVRDRRGILCAISGRLYATSCLRCGGEWVSRCAECEELEELHDSTHHEFDPQALECVKCGWNKPAKYLHSKGFHRNYILYGEHMKEREENGRVWVVEGNFDVLMMWQRGYRPVRALLGSSPGDVQIEKLIRGHERIMVVGDGDDPGREMIRKVRHMVADRLPVFSFELEEDVDPCAMTEEDMLAKFGPPSVLV